MHRFFAEDGNIVGEENAHLTRVLRLREGQEVELLDGERIFLARLTEVGKEASRARILEELPNREAPFRLTLCVGLLKGEKMDWVVQKAAELGVHALCPVSMERQVARDGKTERWRRIAREAQKQCGRASCLIVEEIRPLREICGPHLVVPYEGGGQDFEEGIGSQGDMTLLIGPEGGIAPAEIELLREHGARLVTLGPRILRAETAAIAAVSAAMALRGAWGQA